MDQTGLDLWVLPLGLRAFSHCTHSPMLGQTLLERYSLGGDMDRAGTCNLHHGQPLPSTRPGEMLPLRTMVSRRPGSDSRGVHGGPGGATAMWITQKEWEPSPPFSAETKGT